jgi:citrate synthase
VQINVGDGGTIQGSDLNKIKAGGDGIGLRMYDPGYVNTTAVISRICFIDGAKGILRYRGYPIEQVRLSPVHAADLDHDKCLLNRRLT